MAGKPSSKQYGEFVLGFSWVGERKGEEEPSMWLGRRSMGRGRAWIIPLSAAHEYADSQTGEPTRALVQRSYEIAAHLDLQPTRGTLFRIASAIVDNLPDLIRMPEAPLPTAKDLERMAERDGIKVTVNNEVMIDAT